MVRKLLLCLALFSGIFSFGQDSLTKQRFQGYANPLGLHLDNSVQKQISEWAGPKKQSFEEALGKCTYYFPKIDSILLRYKVPTELKFAALAMSNMEFNYFDANSGARGIWHFNYTQAKLFKLPISSYIDTRLDPIMATEAFAKAMSEYYRIYRNWELALAAFASSAPKVNKAIHYQGDSAVYRAIRGELEAAAASIVAKTLAAALLYHNQQDYRFVVRYFNPPVAAGQVRISDWLSLEQLATKSKVPLSTLAFLNPSFKRNIVPDMADSFTIFLPLALKDSARWIMTLKYIPYDANYFEGGPNSGTRVVECDTIEHLVKPDQTLDSIAAIYKVKVADIQEWNALDEDLLSPGQSLIVLVERKPTVVKPKPKPIPAYRTHTVKSGETLSGIASKYRCTVNEIKKWNNLKSTVIRPGQKLKIH